MSARSEIRETIARQPRRLRGVIITFIVLVQTSQSLAFAGIALFLPLIRTDLGLSFVESGLFAVVSTATYAAMQIPAGYLADRFGPKRVFLIGALGVNALAFGFAVLPTFGLLLADQALSGVFRALMFAPGMLLMTRQFRPDRRATAMGLFVALGFSSNIFLNTLGPLLVTSLGWRNLFIIFSAMGLVFVIVYKLLPDRDQPGAGQTATLADLAAVMKSSILWLCGGIQFVRLAVTMATMTWWPTYLIVEKGMDLVTAGLVLAVGAVLTAPANFIGGYVSDRFNRPLAVVAVSLVIIASTLIGIVNADSLAMLILLISVNQFFLQIYFGPLFEIPIKAIGSQFAGSISGFSNMFANIGALFSVFFMGWFKDAFGTFSFGIYGLVLLCLVSLGFTYALSRVLKARTTVIEGTRP